MSKNNKKKKHRGFWIFFRIQIVLMLLVLAGVAYYYLGGYGSQISALRQEAISYVQHSSKSTFRSSQTTIVYDAAGEEITTWSGAKDVYYLTYEEIPENVKNAIVSIEDKKFYQHSGIDLKAIARAVWAMIQNGEVTQGGSTITQQLARTVFLTNDRTWQRKMEEIFIATELEKKYSKEQILEFYLNNIYFGNGYYGIGAASKGYFGKDVSQLTLSEAAYLCAIPNNPTLYNPVTNPDNTIGRRDRILDQMREDKMITYSAYSEAKKEEITISQSEKPIVNSAVETYVSYCATRILMEQQGFTFQTQFASEEQRQEYQTEYDDLYAACNSSLYTGGYRIYTSIDMNLQQQLQNALDQNLAGYTEVNEEGIYALQGAAVCIDNETGYVKAMVGGRSQEYDGYMLNRAYQSYRQPGSAIKPLLVYTPALERGYTADTILVDEPIEDGPTNANGTYLGEISLRYAVEHSVNTVAWKMLEEITPATGLEYLEKMEFHRLDPEDYRPAIALGGFTNGVSPLEMAAGYATIENDGVFRSPSCVITLRKADGTVLYEGGLPETQVYKPNAARQMTEILTGVMSRGTAAGYGLTSTASAGKTGTTNSNKDGWFVGYTRYYTTSVWVGYDIPKKLPGLSGSGYPAKIWYGFMNEIHKDKEYLEFVPPIQIANPEEAAPEETVPEEAVAEETAPEEAQ
ncbi:MAG: PBP1A family penicillin-binding protein [Lachnospiraceae bacterium]|nr:PBP1A family penicillin-binding protein [Lachnospiraceae bacterium]